MDIEDLKLREISIFLDLVKTKSIREIARQRNMQPGQVSKWIAAMERKLGFTLLERSSHGIQLTPSGRQFLPYLESIERIQQKLSGSLSNDQELPVMGFASTSYFSTYLLPALIGKMSKKESNLKFRVMDLPPSQFIPVALRGAFHFCIHSHSLDWPKTWTSIQVGNLRWQLVCRKGHPLLEKPTAREALKYPFVVPVYWTQEGHRYGDDQCPVPLNQRTKGDETATGASAREIVRVTNQLAFLPELAIRHSVQRGEIKTVNISSWKTVLQPIYFSVKNDVVKQNTFETVKKILQEELAAE